MLSADAGEWTLPKLSAGLQGSIKWRLPLSSAGPSVSTSLTEETTGSSLPLGGGATDSFFSNRAYQGKSLLPPSCWPIPFLAGGCARLVVSCVSDICRLMGFFGAPKALNQADRLGVAVLCFTTSTAGSADFGSAAATWEDGAPSSEEEPVAAAAGVDCGLSDGLATCCCCSATCPAASSDLFDPISLKRTVPKLSCAFWIVSVCFCRALLRLSLILAMTELSFDSSGRLTFDSFDLPPGCRRSNALRAVGRSFSTLTAAVGFFPFSTGGIGCGGGSFSVLSQGVSKRLSINLSFFIFFFLRFISNSRSSLLSAGRRPLLARMSNPFFLCCIDLFFLGHFVGDSPFPRPCFRYSSSTLSDSVSNSSAVTFSPDELLPDEYSGNLGVSSSHFFISCRYIIFL